jgi:hypothetical protein
MKHKFQIGQQVKLPGRQVKTTGYGFANKFAWDAAGTIEALGWSEPQPQNVWTGEWAEKTNQHGLVMRQKVMKVENAKRPVYKVDGKWYSEQQVKQ